MNFSEGRRQDLLSDHKVFPNRPKKINDDVFLRNSVNFFSEGRRQKKCRPSAYVHQCKMIKFNFEGRQQDESKCHWHDGGREPPQCVDPLPSCEN